MAAISDNLIHFLARSDKDNPGKQFKIFKNIIENGLQTSKILIKFAEGASIINQIICFTDIPLRECNEHTSIYGKFGIGFKKSYIKNCGGNPARYFLDYNPGQMDLGQSVESRGGLFHHLCNQYKFMSKINDALSGNKNIDLFTQDGEKLISTSELSQFVTSFIYSFSFDKEMGDLGPARDETREIDLYYKEREWRLVPSHLNLLSNIAKPTSSGTQFLYSFERKDINMIVVPNEEVRKLVLEYFLELRNSSTPRLKDFGDNPLPIINYDDLHNW